MTKKILILLLTLTSLYAESTRSKEKMPIHAKAGQCFTKSFYPPQYTKVTKVTSQKRVVLNDASVKYDVVPAEFTWHEEQVKISDGTEKIVVTPAVYKTVYKTILVEPAKKVWKKSLNRDDVKAFNSCLQSASDFGMDTKNAKVGTCFYEHYKPAKYIHTTEKILQAEASQRIVEIPATYKKVSKKIITDSTSVKLIPSVASYKRVKDKIVIEPARTEWQKTTCQNKGCNQSEVVCLIEVPVTYKNVTKRIVLKPAVATKVAVTPTFKTFYVQELLSPASTKIIPIPAVYTTVNKVKKVEDTTYYWSDALGKNASTRIRTQCNKICLTEIPAKYKKIAQKIIQTPSISKKVKTPAKYKMVKVKKISKKASFKKTIIPAEYITVITERERTKGYSKWMPMVCESNMTPKTIRRVQQALKFQGFYQGEVSGVWSLESKSASRAYQKSKGLNVTSKLSIETMMSLKIY